MICIFSLENVKKMSEKPLKFTFSPLQGQNVFDLQSKLSEFREVKFYRFATDKETAERN